MPDVVVIRVPKEEKPLEPPAPPPSTLLKRFLRALALPPRAVWNLLVRLWKRLFGPRRKP